MILLLAFVLSFCSIVYELILGQSLAAFYGNTVLRYSTTVGLYLLALGVGALVIARINVKNPLLFLVRTELLLTVCGGGSVVLANYFNLSTLPISVMISASYLLVFCIGVCSGFELPLLIDMCSSNISGIDAQNKKSNLVIASNYFGAVVGTVCFGLLFYTELGLIATAFFVGMVNALSAVFLSFYSINDSTQLCCVGEDLVSKNGFIRVYCVTFFDKAISVILCGMSILALWYSNSIEYSLMNWYVG